MTDEVNQLMARCETARRKCEARAELLNEDFHIGYHPRLPGDREWRPSMLWYVGFYEPDQGKCVAAGSTLPIALRQWLRTYEHYWD